MSTFGRATLYISAMIVFSAPGFTQQPTDEQKSAIRAQCRSDYEAHCASVPPGGLPSLQCLQKNIASLSPPCQTAVRAVEPAATPKAEPAPNNQPSPKTETAPSTAPPKATAPPSPTTTSPPVTAPPALTLRPMRPREELMILRSACGGDVRMLCGGIPPGGGRIVQCLASQAASLSPGCKSVLMQFAAP